MLFLLLIVCQLEINLHVKKDTFLVGEDILVRWEIVNNGKEIGFYEEGTGEIYKLANDAILIDSKDREEPHISIQGARILMDSTVPVDTITPGDTVRFQEANLIGIFGSLKFSGIFNFYIKPENYIFSLYYWIGKDLSQKLWSDTLKFSVIEPTGKEKEAWELYKKFRAEFSHVREKEMLEYGYELLTKYQGSVYIGGIIEFSKNVFIAWGDEKESREKMAPTTRKIVDYLEKNVEKFQGRERVLKETVSCITHGELMLGTPKEEVKSKVLQLKLPVSKDVMEVLEIKSEELDTKKK